MKKYKNRRIEHIEKLQSYLINNTSGISPNEVKSLSKVIKILEFVSNKEYQDLYRKYTKSFDEITTFYLDNRVWEKVTNRRREDFQNIKKYIYQREGRDFKLEEYIYLLDTPSKQGSKK